MQLQKKERVASKWKLGNTECYLEMHSIWQHKH